MYVSFWVMVLSKYMPRSGIAGSYGSSRFSFLEPPYSFRTNVHSHQQCRRVPFPHTPSPASFVKGALRWRWETVFSSLYCALVQIRKRCHLGSLPHKLTVNGDSGKYMRRLMQVRKKSSFLWVAVALCPLAWWENLVQWATCTTQPYCLNVSSLK